MRDKINIVMATDENYYKQLVVVIESIMFHRDPLQEYHYWLMTEDVVSLQDYIYSLSLTYDNCVFSFVDMKESFSTCPTPISHITKTTYYRLMIPQLIPVKKCLYLDLDIVVNDDIDKLYNEDIADYYIAGVLAIGYLGSDSDQYKYAEKIGISSLKTYINAGVLLMNLEALRCTDFVVQAEQLSHKDFPASDQDIINILCYGGIKLLSLKFNFQAIRMEQYGMYLAKHFSEEDIKQAMQSPIIVHYVTGMKPWEFLDCEYGHLWWKYCRETSVYYTFLEENEKNFYYYGVIRNKPLWKSNINTAEWYEILKQYEKIYIYGAGKYAQHLVRRLKEKEVKVNSILVTDEAINPNQIEGIQVKKYAIEQIERNAVVLIAMNKLYAFMVQRNLLKDNMFEIYIVDKRL